MKITHKFKSTLPDTADQKRMQPSDWNADHEIEGFGDIVTQNSDNINITGGHISGVNITDPVISGNYVIPVSNGGTGSDNAVIARTNLGLHGMALQNPANVAITGGSISNITDLAISDGGTGASDSAQARTNLNVYSKAEVDALLLALEQRLNS